MSSLLHEVLSGGGLAAFIMLACWYDLRDKIRRVNLNLHTHVKLGHDKVTK